jgi:pyridinium-3,5-biscarboxylic acid mononucleotide synthase
LTRERIAELLREVRRGRVGVDEALDRLRGMPYEDLGYAKIDHHRPLRQGMPEVIFGRGKTPQQIERLVEHMLPHGDNVLVTRTDAAVFERVRKLNRRARFHTASGAIDIRLDRRIRAFSGRGLLREVRV